ncbi:class I SAM-dependent methyltransferase [Streptomyces sp. 6N223]|uniref:class I SAM-dependent methyltransferase n=1 Tax=Streptomyces sp. 6N223 TaxID=3457412 RepID=UPI003FD2D80D
MHIIENEAEYWDHYACGVTLQPAQDALKRAFGWTQYDGHGPGEELLGDPSTALELGSGTGAAVAALASKGIEATGIDLSGEQCARARERWGHLPNARFVQADTVDWLASRPQRWQAVYSIWGAAWFTDPDVLLPLVHDRLTPGGRLVFSHAAAVPGSYGRQGMYGNGFAGRAVWVYRWAFEPAGWTEILNRHGFRDVRVWTEPAPDPRNVGTLIASARP